MKKVWIYLSNKELKGDLLNSIVKAGEDFAKGWKAHEMPLSASFEVLNGRFIVVSVDETAYNASGCSIDKLLRLIKQLEADHQLQLLNRLLVGYKTPNGVEVIPASSVKEKLNTKQLNENTLIYNVAASDSKEYKAWLQPLKETWLKKYL
ncbi:MAG: hypothetical protein SGJ15_12625 [Bacteroidota bacterium]|nr:hypothetical protein [Bacteroidota bacterium]